MVKLSGNRGKNFKKLDHPSIVKLSSVHLINLQGICFVYELLDSLSVATHFRNKRLKPHHVSIILKPVVSALSYILSVGFIHQDVHAKSVLISSEGDIKLNSFSLAKQLILQ